MDEEVVIVSNDAQGRAAFGVALVDQGYTVHVCHNVADAALQVASAAVGVLLVDCASIPITDGLRLARDCRAQHPQLRCLVICNDHNTTGDGRVPAGMPDIDPADSWLHVLHQPYSMVRFATTMKEIIAAQ